jgi:pyridoxal phosphate enzyme (YggS family)
MLFIEEASPLDRVTDILLRNLRSVEQRIQSACQRAGRDRSEVTLVGITKYVDIDVARRLHDLGVNNLGESRPQELWRKAEAIPEATWHLVGHLQRNKIERTVQVARLIHSVDSPRLIEALEAAGRDCDVLIEVNLSGEANKTGLKADLLDEVLERSRGLQRVRIKGLMTMSALEASREQIRHTFGQLRQLRHRAQVLLSNDSAWPELSMGMTSDFEIAIEEGATLVRIGSALFTGLEGAKE